MVTVDTRNAFADTEDAVPDSLTEETLIRKFGLMNLTPGNNPAA